MYITCLDMEGVLVPEIWIAFAEASGIPALKRTTRDEPDYHKLMEYRLGILREHGLGLREIQATIAQIDPLPGARAFLDELRSFTQVLILSDTFEQFAQPLMKKLNWPTLFCNTLEVAPDGASPANLPELYDRTIVVNGFSKSHAMTGWRMGYVCGPAPILQQMLKLHQFGIMSAPTTSQYAAIEAMRNGDVDIEKMRDEYDGRRRYLVEGLRRIGLPCFEPKGAFYVFPDIRGTGLTSDEFCERFLMEEKVAVISGAAFGPGGEGFIRCCYATSMKDIAEALTRMDNFLTNLRKKQAREG